MSTMRLSKLHATGNDFLVRLDLDGRAPALDARAIATLCDRHRGVGADGLITVRPGGTGADCAMTLGNADGGPAEMSGNGIRCLAWIAARAGLGDGTELTVETAAGRRVVRLWRDRGQIVGAEVDMGPVTFVPAEIPIAVDDPFDLETVVDDVHYRGDAAGMGNPHFVLFVEDLTIAPVTIAGPVIEHDARFPHRTNVEFIAVNDTDALSMRVWERGAGETLSCGTGACAAAAVARRRGLVGERVQVQVPGGTLAVTLADTVSLGGPVVHVFDLDVDVDPNADRERGTEGFVAAVRR
jgi:diaminopimelate epimerase